MQFFFCSYRKLFKLVYSTYARALQKMMLKIRFGAGNRKVDKLRAPIV